MMARPSLRRGLALVAVLLTIAAGCSSNDPTTTESTKPSSTPSPSGSVTVTFGVYGPKAVTDAYKQLAADYTVAHPRVKVSVHVYPNHEEAMAAVRSSAGAGQPSDLFLIDHEDLAGLSDAKALRRVDDLLAQREVDFGDGYTRNGLEAFSSDAALRCMPQSVSPLVVYYNPKLIELDKIRDPGANPVTQEGGWSLDDFRRAAAQPRRPGVRGLYVAPELTQVAPFIWSGGGDVVDDTDKPTTLTLSDGASAGALEKLLEIVRNPGLTFSEQALRRRSALERFKAGQLGMILGYRDLTPVLRAQPNLTFDVMPLPRVGSSATISRMTGLCISSKSTHTEQAADFLAALISDRDASVLAATGYVMPANLDVLNSDDFLQTGERPLHSGVFQHELRRSQMLPSSTRWPLVASATEHELTQLFYQPVILPLQDRLQGIDQASIPLFNPATGTPSSSPTASPSPGS